jgi:hypothetical protein
VIVATNRLEANARRKLGSPATCTYHFTVAPVGSRVLNHDSPKEPTNSSAIGATR